MYEDAHLESQYEDANGGTVDLDDDYGTADDEDGGCVIRRGIQPEAKRKPQRPLTHGPMCANCGQPNHKAWERCPLAE